jgi:gp16 family phage-associated protein
MLVYLLIAAQMNQLNQTRQVEETKNLIEQSGVSLSEWARANGFSTGLVYQVLAGKRKCMRGQSFRIAVALGIKGGAPLDVDQLSKLLKQT